MAIVREEVLEQDGDWEIRVNVYRNGRRVGFTDANGDDYQFCVQSVTTDLERKVLSK